MIGRLICLNCLQFFSCHLVVFCLSYSRSCPNISCAGNTPCCVLLFPCTTAFKLDQYTFASLSLKVCFEKNCQHPRKTSKIELYKAGVETYLSIPTLSNCPLRAKLVEAYIFLLLSILKLNSLQEYGKRRCYLQISS